MQGRDFVYVANVVQALTRAATAPAATVAGQVYNVGNGQSTTILELASQLNRLLGQNVTPLHAPPRAGDVRFSEADISKIRQDLKYEPRVSFADGLAETLKYHQQSQEPRTK